MNKTVWRDFPVFKQEFSQYEDEYFLNKDGELELFPAKKDCQAYIDSQFDTVYQKMLEALMQPVPESLNVSSDYIAEREAAAGDLEAMLEADQVFENARLEIPELKGATRAQVVAYLKNKVAEEYKPKVSDNIETNSSESQSEQKELSPDGAKG